MYSIISSIKVSFVDDSWFMLVGQPRKISFNKRYDLDKIKSMVKDIWDAQNIKSDIRTLKVEEQGAIVY